MWCRLPWASVANTTEMQRGEQSLPTPWPPLEGLRLCPGASRYGLALVSGCGFSCPANYLEPEGRVLSMQTPPTSMLVLCVKMPSPALLEIMDDLRQNVSCMTTDRSHDHPERLCDWSCSSCLSQPAYSSAFDPRNRGYLVHRLVEGKGQTRGRGCRRYWCVLDGSSLLCYNDEEVRGLSLQLSLCSSLPGRGLG